MVTSQNLKPYTLAITSEGTVQELSTLVKEQLINNGFQILGQYAPDHHNQSRIIAFTSEEIIEAVKKGNDLAGFAMAQRIAITPENGKVTLSYTHPEYWGNAYFRSDYKKVNNIYKSVADNLESTMKACGSKELTYFGSEEGLPAKRVQNYRYKVLMPQFDDTDIVGKFDTYSEAVDAIESNLKTNSDLLTQVYSIKLPGKNIKLYGIGMAGENGESKFMPKIDINNPKHTAFLPYEILVVENKVHMLAGRYRIALSFPDLSMGTFMKIVSTPGDIKDMMKLLCNKPEQDN
jgi:uncharacterized protein (DUF302 family)